MAAATEAVLFNKSNNKHFWFRCIAPYKNRQTQNSIAIPLVNTGPANTILFKFAGKTEKHNFQFALFNDGTDVSAGTHSSTVITVDQQIDYLKNEMFQENFDVDWTLTQSRYAPSGVDGLIMDLEFDNPPGGVSLVTGNFVFQVGRIGAL